MSVLVSKLSFPSKIISWSLDAEGRMKEDKGKDRHDRQALRVPTHDPCLDPVSCYPLPLAINSACELLLSHRIQANTDIGNWVT